MAGRISEYLTLSKVLGTELVDVSAVDAGSPTGYTTLKTTVQDLADFNPSIYSASGDLAGNRTVNQNGNNLFFNDGDFGLDFGNQGFFYEDLTRRIGIGTQSPSSSLHIKGQSGDDLFILEDSIGISKNIVKENGQISTGINMTATTNTIYGQYHKSNDISNGFVYENYGTSPVNTFIHGRTDSSNPTLILGRYAGNQAGTIKGIDISLNSNAATNSVGVLSVSSNGSSTSKGVEGQAINNNPSNILCVGVDGLGRGIDNTFYYGTRGITEYNAINQLETNKVGTGVLGQSRLSNNASNSGCKAIGGDFRATGEGELISIISPASNNLGVVVFGADSRQGDSTLQTTGGVRMQGLPTSSAGLAAGELWNDAGTLKIA